MNNESTQIKALTHSKLGILSFVLAILGVALYGSAQLLSILKIVSLQTAQYIMFLCILAWLISLFIGVLDLFKKNRRRLLSVIAVIISFIPLFLFTLLIALIQILHQVSK
jgi:ABC-type dipeptide/oligopeptide/nickel transport system permease component